MSRNHGMPIFLGTQAIRQKSPQITFESAAEMLSTFGMQQGGSQYRRLVASFQGIFGATIFFGTDSQSERAVVVHRARFNFMTGARIWYSRDPKQKLLPGDCQNRIVLSEEFNREIQAHPIPTDLEAARALSSSPFAIWPVSLARNSGSVLRTASGKGSVLVGCAAAWQPGFWYRGSMCEPVQSRSPEGDRIFSTSRARDLSPRVGIKEPYLREASITFAETVGSGT